MQPRGTAKTITKATPSRTRSKGKTIAHLEFGNPRIDIGSRADYMHPGEADSSKGLTIHDPSKAQLG
jgi:hypothetical protein